MIINILPSILSPQQILIPSRNFDRPCLWSSLLHQIRIVVADLALLDIALSAVASGCVSPIKICSYFHKIIQYVIRSL